MILLESKLSLKVDSWKKIFQIMACKLDKERRWEEHLYQRKLIEIEKNLHDKEKDIELEKDLVCTMEKLRNIQNANFQGQKIRAKAN